jgi:hypothetical protein
MTSGLAAARSILHKCKDNKADQKVNAMEPAKLVSHMHSQPTRIFASDKENRK